jgi:hypothetical protein
MLQASAKMSFNRSAVLSPLPFVCKDLNLMGKIKATITSLFFKKPHPMMKSNPIPNLYAKISTQGKIKSDHSPSFKNNHTP